MIRRIAKKKTQENSPDDGAGRKRVIANHPEWEKKKCSELYCRLYNIYLYKM